MEINYGFVDDNNLLLETAVCAEGDFDTIERVRQEFGAAAYYPIGEAVALIRSSIWTGEYFTPGSPFLSWVWDYAREAWIPPITYPDDGLVYDWDEDSRSWVVIPTS